MLLLWWTVKRVAVSIFPIGAGGPVRSIAYS